ncbi:dynamin family protein [Limnoraphis robusta Tam1]|uniref:dynamin family protein n=1 Tax=Limnoraphis robusta TaxID=1118279 RepID=UPI002B214A82|nr:dynamin family protein [Limnoraphis robusta]MEA5540406.1 dynamin family protein [Limnoraphis robusta Tam1]
MIDTTKQSSLLNNLEAVSRKRYEIAHHLGNLAEILSQAEREGEQTSGKLALEADIEDLSLASQNLRKGVFRILVLGDLKRGKSTLINALIGEKLLPSDVNPCTAILTILRYGINKKVTVYFKGDKQPEELEFKDFKRQYTIDPTESKRFEEEHHLAFPDVDHAVIEYPLPLLEKGVEIVDSPGLNDTEARNQLSLSYINNCHAILFVFRAIQPFTLEERRYLENYIKERGLTVFFLINAWDEIQKEILDADDTEHLENAEEKIRQVFKTNLTEYCQYNGYDIYDERVFELSSLNALRQQIKSSDASLEGTGFPEFTQALNHFLTQERAIAEFRQARTLARQTYNHVHEAVERRIPLLGEDINELKKRINSVEPEFKKLAEIRDQFQKEIQTTRNDKSKSIANSLHTYIISLGDNFANDFVRYQPDLGFLDFLSQDKREQFNMAFKQAFERYINEKMAAWEKTAEKEIKEAFSQLAQSASNYGGMYSQVTNLITEKLTQQTINSKIDLDYEENSPKWASWAVGFFSLASGNVAGIILAGAGFDWKNILVNYLGVIGVSSFLLLLSGGLLASVGIWAIPILGLGVGAVQVEQARKDFMKVIQKEFIKYLPQVANEQQETMYEIVNKCFDSYEAEILKQINNDIDARKSELDNLLQQKESQEINREKEVERLHKLDNSALSEKQNIESIYENLLSSSV